MSLENFSDYFLLNAAYELKAPLHGIMNLSKIIEETEREKLSVENKKNFDFMTATAKRFSGLIDDIVDLHQLTENKISLQLHSFDCRGVIQHAVESLSRFAEEKGLGIFNELPIGHCYVMADESRLKSIIFMLIENAIRFTDYGKIVINGYHADGKVHITFTDTGVGIAEGRRNALAMKGQEGDHEHQMPEAGPGLDFYIASWMVRHMDGELKVKWTEVGSGTCMELVLPQGEPEIGLSAKEAKGGVRINEEEIEVQQPSEESGATILIVDDEPSELLMLKQFFAQNKYRVITARTGAEAVRILEKQGDTALVLLDVLLPDISGYMVCRKLREKYNLYELPILLLTARNTPMEIHEGMTAGANDFITKPFVHSEMVARVQTHLGLKEAMKKTIDMEIMFLQSQIKPHFVYNAISVITGLCFTDGNKAGELMVQFGNYLRKTFDVDYRSNEVSLEEELSLIRSYVALEKARFGQRVNVIYELGHDTVACKIPALILQPLVENAIRHGILQCIEGGTVIIRSRRDTDYIELQVADDGIGMSQDKRMQLFDAEVSQTGVALKNIKRRMRSYYNQELKIESEPGKGTVITLRIPLKSS